MSLRTDIEATFLDAMRAKDAPKLSALRMLRSALKNFQIDKMRELTDEDTVEIVSKEVKKLRDSATDFEKAGRADLLASTNAEIAILSVYLPAQLSEEEVRAIVKEKAAETGAAAPSDMGKLTGAVMKAVKGKADGGLVSRLVKEHLQ